MGKTALITGASSGLGLEFSRIFARNGYDLVVVARSEGKLYKLKADLESAYGIQVFVCSCDLSERDAALDVFDYCLQNDLRVECLVNNAGFGDQSNFLDADWQKQYEMVQVNIVAMMQLTKCFLKPMISSGEGRILNLSSVAAFCAGPRMSVYYAVTALCPGPTATGFEKAAEMKNSRMFTFFKPASAREVAEAGYRAMMHGRVLYYYGAATRLMNVCSRIFPRRVSREFAKKING